MNYIIACVPCLGRRREDPERERLFPPPDTILTPPRTRGPLPHVHSAGASSTSSPLLSPTTVRDITSPGLSKVSRERIGTISRAYQGRMMPLARQSRPPSQSSATPFPHPFFTTFSGPFRPAAPNLGRSISEPRSLASLAKNSNSPDPLDQFASTQIPPSARRPRSATGLDTISSSPRQPTRDSLALMGHVLDFEGDRGRSPGPSRLGIGRSTSAGHMPGLAVSEISEEEDNQEQGVEVVHRELGLKDLPGYTMYRRSRGRGKGKGSRGSSGARRVTS